MVNSTKPRNCLRRTCYLVLLLACLAGTDRRPQDRRAGDTPQIGTKVGQMYPDFLLPKLDGDLGRLSDYRGKKVLLIHFASW